LTADAPGVASGVTEQAPPSSGSNDRAIFAAPGSAASARPALKGADRVVEGGGKAEGGGAGAAAFAVSVATGPRPAAAVSIGEGAILGIVELGAAAARGRAFAAFVAILGAATGDLTGPAGAAFAAVSVSRAGVADFGSTRWALFSGALASAFSGTLSGSAIGAAGVARDDSALLAGDLAWGPQPEKIVIPTKRTAEKAANERISRLMISTL